jgi:hypothetical protein
MFEWFMPLMELIGSLVDAVQIRIGCLIMDTEFADCVFSPLANSVCGLGDGIVL